MASSTFTETLTLERVFNASVDKVFDAWTKAEVLAQWFGPVGFTVVRSDVDCRVEGKYEIVIQSPDNNQIRHFGEYLVVDNNQKLVFTWILEDQACEGSEGQLATTLVELDFVAEGPSTRLILKHEKLPDQKSMDGHQFGWSSSFDSLAEYIH